MSSLTCPNGHGAHYVVADSATAAHCARCDWRIDVSARESTGDARDRFWSKVDTSGECWVWTACKNSKGYGQISIGGRLVYAHRYAYELLVGPIPEVLELDHLCRVRHCVNPAHLEPVTHAENVRRGDGGLHHAIKTHCPQGHPYDESNIYARPGTPDYRECRECRRVRGRERKRAQRALMSTRERIRARLTARGVISDLSRYYRKRATDPEWLAKRRARTAVYNRRYREAQRQQAARRLSATLIEEV